MKYVNVTYLIKGYVKKQKKSLLCDQDNTVPSFLYKVKTRGHLRGLCENDSIIVLSFSDSPRRCHYLRFHGTVNSHVAIFRKLFCFGTKRLNCVVTIVTIVTLVTLVTTVT